MFFLSGTNFDDYIIRTPGSNFHFQCSLCSKQSTTKFNLKKHIENIHFPGVYQHSCKVCGETLPTANKLNHHMTRNHPNVSQQNYKSWGYQIILYVDKSFWKIFCQKVFYGYVHSLDFGFEYVIFFVLKPKIPWN